MKTSEKTYIKSITVVNGSTNEAGLQSRLSHYANRPNKLVTLSFDGTPTAEEYVQKVKEAIARCKKYKTRVLYLDKPERYLSPEDQVKLIEYYYENCIKYTPLGYEYYSETINPQLLVNTQSPHIIERFKQYLNLYYSTGGYDQGIGEWCIDFSINPNITYTEPGHIKTPPF